MRLLIAGLMFLFSVLLGAQELRFSHLDQKQGLSQNTATAFLRDREGFIWVGTQDGLNRYDGYSFSVYRNIAGDVNSLSDNFILTLAEDTDGNIWVGTRNGLSVYSKPENKFYRYTSPYDDPNQFHASVRLLYALRDGGVIYKTVTEHVLSVRYFPDQHKADTTGLVGLEKVNTFCYDPHTNVMAVIKGSKIRIGQLNQSAEITVDYKPLTNVSPLITISNGVVFISDSIYIHTIPFAHSGLFRTIEVSETPVTCMRGIPDGTLWVGTADGLRILSDPEHGDEIIVSRENQEDYFSLAGNRVETIYSSVEGLIWIGTVGGVNVYDPLQARFSLLKGIFSNKDQDAIWFAMSFSNVTLWANDKGLNSSVAGTAPRWLSVIPKELLYSAGGFDSRNRLWLGTKKQGVVIIDTLNATIDLRFRNETTFLETAVMDFCSDGKGNMWVAGIGSLCVVNESDFNLTCLRNKSVKNSIGSSYFTSLEKDESGRMYAGTAKGLYRFDNPDTNFTLYNYVPGNENSLAYNIINDLEYSSGVMWIATMGYGFDRFDTRTGSFTHYTTVNGLSNNTIYGIEIAADGNIWLSSNEGLIQFDTATSVFRNYTMRDGLPSNEFVINKHSKNTADGSLYFGSSDGLVHINPQQFSGYSTVALPVLTKLMINYEEVSVYRDSMLLLTPAERNVSFEFTVIDFRNQDKVTYAYMLEGFDTSWHNTSSYNRIAAYTNLPYGEYTFRVRYKVSGGEWSHGELSLKLLIETPFYALWWFRLVAGFSGILIIALFVRYISQRRLRKQVELFRVQEKIRNEKERIARDLHDNVGAQLTYVISSLDNLSYSLGKHPDAEKEAGKMEQLGEFARGTMDQLRESIWAINSEQISLSELSARWKLYLSQLADTRDGISGSVETQGPDVVLKPSVAIEVHRIVQEAISNAFRHSGGNRIVIEVDVENGRPSVSVIDNGHGMGTNPEKAGHYGLNNMKERARRIEADLSFQTSEEGTTVHLYWPNK